MQSIIPIEYINRINWHGLSCFDRAFAITCENIKKDSGLCFLLLKYIGRNYNKNILNAAIGSDDYYNYIFNLIGIDCEFKVVPSCHMYKTIKDELLDSYIIIITNNKYESESNCYGKEDHPHFIPISEIGNNGIYVIDECYEKQYWKEENTYNGVIYKKKYITFNKVEKIIKNISSFSKLKKYNNDILAYYKLRKSTDDILPKKEIMNIYFRQLFEYINHYNSIKKNHMQYMLNFEKNLDSCLTKLLFLANKKISNISENKYIAVQQIKNWLVFPNDSAVMLLHESFIYAQLRLFELGIISGNELYSLRSLFSEYERFKQDIAKAVVSGFSYNNHIIQKTSVLFDYEMNIYKRIIYKNI